MENKTKDIFLLGAGASVEAGLPTASELFDRLSNDLNNSEWKNLLIELKKTSGNKFEDAISALEFVSNQNFSNLELNLLKIITNNQFDITKERLVDIYKLIDYIKRLWINQKFIIKNPENICLVRLIDLPIEKLFGDKSIFKNIFICSSFNVVLYSFLVEYLY